MKENNRFLQTEFWASFKSRHGWKKLSIDFEGNKIQVLTRTFSLKIKSATIAYIPMAPEFTAGDYSLYLKKLDAISREVKKILPQNTICIRFDPPVEFYTFEERDSFVKKLPSFIKESGVKQLHPSFVNIQPPDTTIIDLTKTEDEILAAMKNKWRYNIRLAAKKNVNVEKYEGGSENITEAFEHFYTLFKQTSERDGVSFHAKDYYIDLLTTKSYEDDPKITLYLAKHEEDYLAGIITLFCKGEAVYLYGASGNIKRNLMPAYLLQWTAIQDAKNFGCPSYDFYGMPPAQNENHPMHGLYLFKTGFGGQNTHRMGSIDYVLKKADYKLYSFLEKLRAFYFKKVKKLLKK